MHIYTATHTVRYNQFYSAKNLQIVSFSSLANVLLKSFPILLRSTKVEIILNGWREMPRAA